MFVRKFIYQEISATGHPVFVSNTHSLNKKHSAVYGNTFLKFELIFRHQDIRHVYAPYGWIPPIPRGSPSTLQFPAGTNLGVLYGHTLRHVDHLRNRVTVTLSEVPVFYGCYAPAWNRDSAPVRYYNPHMGVGYLPDGPYVKA
ncbi:unnamed protein product, partial [Amoebophrya sp. A25]|eukprot:GSA25T00015973001.1